MSDENKTGEAQAQQNNEEPQFIIQRIYIKDASFESPNTPAIYNEEWKPEPNLQLNTATRTLAEDHYEVELNLTVTVKSGDKVAFLVEVKQAGIFMIRGYPQNHMGQILGSFCPSNLFPYAREAVANLVSKGGFPELHLSPINFDTLYAQHVQQQQAQAESAGATETVQ